MITIRKEIQSEIIMINNGRNCSEEGLYRKADKYIEKGLQITDILKKFTHNKTSVLKNWGLSTF